MLRHSLFGAGIENLRSMGEWRSFIWIAEAHKSKAMLRLLPLVEAVSHPIINNGKNGNEASFDTGAPFFKITPKQMRWLHIRREASFVCVKNSIKPGRRVSSNVSSGFALCTEPAYHVDSKSIMG
jgi:hypothetical protein